MCCLWFPPDTSTGGWETVCERRLPLSLTHPLSSSFNTHLLFLPFYEATKCPKSSHFLTLLLLLSGFCAPAETSLAGLPVWILIRVETSILSVSVCLFSKLAAALSVFNCLLWPPEVSTFNPRCFRPENAYIRVKIAMWEQVCALLSLFQTLSQS